MKQQIFSESWCRIFEQSEIVRSIWLFARSLLIAFALYGSASSAGEVSPVGSDPQPTPIMGHSHEEAVANIRKHHLSRLNARLTTDPIVLRQTCRYVSEISTAPPRKQIALTFDDGPEPGQTELILEILKKHNISAAFFMIGRKAKQYPDLVEKVHAAGHLIIGNHSWDHPNFHDIGEAEQTAEVLRSEAVLSNYLQPKLFRYPFGNSTCETNQLVRSRGYRIVGWHIDSCDWAFDKTGSVDTKEAISCGVLSQYHDDYVGHVISAARARNGGIVLMHDIHPNTVKKLDEIITHLTMDGFVFGTILDADFQTSLR
ncbi:MAG: polysaccharide deacetylase family protein [Betaproteobacteria bacterium]